MHLSTKNVLFSYRNSPNYVGATYHGMACDPKLAAGIALVCILFPSFSTYTFQKLIYTLRNKSIYSVSTMLF